MAEKRVQIAYHFKIDPAQLIPGAVRIPETITRTIAVGDEFTTDKIASACLPPADRAAIIAEINKQTSEANRTAKPLGEEEPAATQPGPAGAGDDEEEISAF